MAFAAFALAAGRPLTCGLSSIGERLSVTVHSCGAELSNFEGCSFVVPLASKHFKRAASCELFATPNHKPLELCMCRNSKHKQRCNGDYMFQRPVPYLIGSSPYNAK